MKDRSGMDDAELWLDRAPRRYAPGDRIVASYRLGGWRAAGLVAIETSLLWCTSGVGEEDFGVHFFERRRFDADEASDAAGEFEAVLPPSPLSYDGHIVRVCWAARLRGFFARGRQRVVEAAFELGLESGATPTVARLSEVVG